MIMEKRMLLLHYYPCRQSRLRWKISRSRRGFRRRSYATTTTTTTTTRFTSIWFHSKSTHATPRRNAAVINKIAAEIASVENTVTKFHRYRRHTMNARDVTFRFRRRREGCRFRSIRDEIDVMGKNSLRSEKSKRQLQLKRRMK